MILMESGVKVLICHRRLFDRDHPRFFFGVVDGYENGLMCVTGHTWVRSYDGTCHRKADERTKIVSVTSGTVIVYQLPRGVDLNNLRMDADDGTLIVRDGAGFEMDLSEGISPANHSESEAVSIG
jgi:hypothetical protein